MSTELTQSGYENIKSADSREEHIGQSLLAKEHFKHYMAVADFLSKSSMVPKGMQNKPSDILIAMEMGLQIGIPMMQAIQDIAVINGKPCMYGDGLLAVVQGHKDYEWIQESVETQGSSMSAVCIIKRKNHEPHRVIFSSEDAKKASLWGKQGPWSQYPARMLQMRARGFCIRDIFSDALRGIKTEEEINDYPAEEKSKPEKSIVESLQNSLNKKPEPRNCIVMADDGQLKEIHMLIHAKDFSKDRVEAAMKHYKITAFNELSSEQALDFISKLNKEADRE